jgi:hypothetical protein
MSVITLMGTRKRQAMRRGLPVYFFVLLGNLSSPAFAATSNSGLDTPTGVATLPFSVQGQEMMQLTQVGLGIGTTSPSTILQVRGGADANLITYASTNLGAGTMELSNVNDANNVNEPIEFDAGKFNFAVGNVGINTTNPFRALTVNGGELAIIRQSNNWTYLNISDANASNGQSSNLDIRGLDVAGTQEVSLNSVFLNATRVGVGIWSPQATLDVNGEVRAGNTGVGCGSNNAGAIRFNGVTFQGCNGSAWISLATGLPPNASVGYAEPSIGMPCAFSTDANGVPTATSYRNTPSGWQVESNIYGQNSNQSTFAANCAPNVCLYTTVCTLSTQGMTYSTFYATSIYNGASNDQSNYTTVVPWN